MYDSELPVRCRNVSGTLYKSRLGSGERLGGHQGWDEPVTVRGRARRGRDLQPKSPSQPGTRGGGHELMWHVVEPVGSG